MSGARTALIGDIHGNFVALDAVPSDSERRGVDGVVCLGDLAAGGLQPREAIGRVRDLGCAAVRGNADEWLLGLHEIVAWGRAQLTERDCEWLGELPLSVELNRRSSARRGRRTPRTTPRAASRGPWPSRAGEASDRPTARASSEPS
jgi:hypothetical protein